MENQEQAQQPELNISDLQNIRILLEVASNRGAFRAQELTSVGAVFDRLNGFLNAVAPQTAESSTESDQQAAE
jgi:hypothetical protein